MRTLSIETTIHGRVLVEDAAVAASRGWLVGFHGYGQAAEDMLDELQQLNADGGWSIAAPQALHRFYTRGDERVVASWMTRQDRGDAVLDNVGYVNQLVGAIQPAPNAAVVFIGFSQGASMAYRAAALGHRRAAAVVALAGDIPPEVRRLDRETARDRFRRVIIGTGSRDSWYTAAKAEADAQWLESSSVPCEVVRFAGGHEWTDEFRAAVRARLP